MVQLLPSFTFNTAQASRQRFLPRAIFLFFFSLSQSIRIFVSRIPQIIDLILIIQSVSSTRCYLPRLPRSQCPRTIGSLLPTAGVRVSFHVMPLDELNDGLLYSPTNFMLPQLELQLRLRLLVRLLQRGEFL